MEKLHPDHHKHPMRQSAQSLEGADRPPLTYLAENLHAILDRHPKSRIEDLMFGDTRSRQDSPRMVAT
jgi:hypothetical protein